MLRHIVWGASLAAATALGCGSRSLPDDQGQRPEAPDTVSTSALVETCPSTVYVQLNYPGASVDEVVQTVTLQLEHALSDFKGLMRIESRSREGEARLWLEFSRPTDAEQVRAHLATHLGDTLPSDAEEPSVFAASASPFETTPIRVRGEPSTVSEALSLLRDEGLDARVVGARARFIRVRLDPKRLAAFGRTRDQIRAALAAVPSPPPRPLGTNTNTASDPILALAELDLSAAGEATVRLEDLATIEFATAPTPVVLDASGELGLIAAARALPASVLSQLPPHIQLTSGDPISAPRCHEESLQGLATVVAVRVDAPDVTDEARRLLTELAGLDPEVVALVGVSEGFGLDLTSSGADLHLLFPTAGPEAVLQRLRTRAGVEPLRVWAPPGARVAVLGQDTQRRDLARRALQGALEDAGFYALTPKVDAEPRLSFTLSPTAAALGLTEVDVARQVRSAVGTEPLTRIRARGTTVPVILESASDLSNPRELAALQLQTPDGSRIPLSAVASVELGQSPAEQLRIDRQAAGELQTNAPRSAVLAAWAKLASEYPGITLLAD